MRASLRLILCLVVLAPVSAFGETANGNIAVTATVTPACVVSATNAVVFPAFDPTNNEEPDGAGSIEVTCTKNHGFTVSLDSGTAKTLPAGFPAGRYMQLTAGTDLVKYELFTDLARSTVWNSGLLVAKAGNGKTAVTVPVYGKIQTVANNDPVAGNYSDSVTVTVAY
jgi:spore coat protein U-like protein